MTTATLTRLYLAEYARRPLNLVLLMAVPVIFVTLSAGALAEFAELVGASAGTAGVTSATASWAAAFLAGVAGFFHVRSSSGADRRLAGAGLGAGRVVVARLLSGTVLAALAAGGGLLALAVRTGIDDPVRAALGTASASIIYLAVGIVVGTLARSEVNGSLVVIFVWMFDVFLGPAMNATDAFVVRLFPTHFPTLFMLDAASGHGGPLTDVGWTVVWTVGAVLLAAVVFASGTAPPEHVARRVRERRQGRLRVAFRHAFVEYRRNRAMWLLLMLLPIGFITLAFLTTADDPAIVSITENGVTTPEVLSMVDVHGAIMVPITVAFLAGLAGLFVVQGSREADRRLVLAGYRPSEVLAARLGVIVAAALLATGVSLAVTAFDFAPASWVRFTAANLVTASTYGLLGVIVGSLVGRLGGLYVMFLLPFVDIGLAQNPMFDAAPPGWASWMPGYGAGRVLVDAAFTSGFDATSGAAFAVVWLGATAVVAAWVFRRLAAPDRT